LIWNPGSNYLAQKVQINLTFIYAMAFEGDGSSRPPRVTQNERFSLFKGKSNDQRYCLAADFWEYDLKKF